MFSSVINNLCSCQEKNLKMSDFYSMCTVHCSALKLASISKVNVIIDASVCWRQCQLVSVNNVLQQTDNHFRGQKI